MIGKKIQVWLPLLFSITLVAGMYLGFKMRDNMPGKSFFYTETRRPIQEILDLVRNKYVDDVEVDSLADTAIQAMLSKLDPHSVYIPAGQLQRVNEDLAGKFFGIGIEFNIFYDTLNVVNVLKDGPGDKAGLLCGDKFLKVDDSAVAGKKTDPEKLRKLLRGDQGSEVTITLLRGNAEKKVTLTRGAIPLSSVDAGYMITKDVGYIRLNKFSSQTYREFMETLEGLKKQGMQKLLLDLRDNGGGILDEAVEIADEFLDGDKLITYTEGRHVAKKEYRCRRTGQFEKGSIVVLADEGTASASEVLIGALQDWDRATIVGRRTFGKGLVQEQFDLSDNSALRLTIARYYTPIGRSIQRAYNMGGKAYFNEIANRYHDGETQSADSVRNDTTKIFKTKSGKTVYGGGGITPDYFIALDTTEYNNLQLKLIARGTLSNFVYHYYLDNKLLLNSFKKPSDFIAGYQLPESAWEGFKALAASDSLPVEKISPKLKDQILSGIRANLARLVWRSEGYFEMSNTTDSEVKKALEILEKQ